MTRGTAHWLWVIMLAVAITGCSSVPNSEETVAFDDAALTDAGIKGATPDFDFGDDRDPFENFNRVLWDFNRDKVDPYLLLPVANTYEKVPSVIRKGIYNLTDNLQEPVNFINNILQLKIGDAGINVSRFLMNSTMGFLGFFDVASSVGILEQKESLGETLAVYGVPQGPYIMLPGAGPTVLIDRGGELADSVLWPSLIYGWPFTIVKYALRGLEQRIELKQLEPMLENSIDEYSFVREAYFSYWLDKVYDGNAPIDSMWDDPWDSDWDDDWNDGAFNPSAAVQFNYQSWQYIKQEMAAPH